MKVIVMGMLSLNVQEVGRSMAVSFADEVNIQLGGHQFESKLDTTYFEPRIVSNKFGSPPESVSFRRSQPAARLRMVISHRTWLLADKKEKAQQYCDAFLRGVCLIKDAKMSASDREKTIQSVQRVKDMLISRELTPVGTIH